MTTRRLTAFVNALAAGRRPGSFRADPEDVEVLRTAITLRAARPGDATPDQSFVDGLHAELAGLAGAQEKSNVHPFVLRPRRAALIGVAASVALIGGTFAVTEASDHGASTTSAVQVPHGTTLRTGTFETAAGQVLGQIVVYKGHPSWVYMNVDYSRSNGTVMCELQLENGSIVGAGTVVLHHGAGTFSKSIRMNTERVKKALLFNSAGAVLASATFA